MEIKLVLLQVFVGLTLSHGLVLQRSTKLSNNDANMTILGALPAGVVELWRTYRPCGECKDMIRVGSAADGGYIMCNEVIPGSTALYSFGINGHDGWGAELSSQLRIPVHQYDCFNTAKPPCPAGMTCNFDFHPECIGKTVQRAGPRTYGTLRSLMESQGDVGKHGSNMLMKMDIDYAEYPILSDRANKPLLQQFSQLNIEFHMQNVAQYTQQLTAMKNLLEDFVVVHMHGNNCCGVITSAEGWTVPKVFELTFVRKGHVKEIACKSQAIESRLNATNVPGNPPLAEIRLPN